MNKKNKIIILFLSSLIFFLIAANIFIYNNPRYSRRALANYYQELSTQASPYSNQAKRYRAISEALKQGKNIYYFTTQKVVPLNQK